MGVRLRVSPFVKLPSMSYPNGTLHSVEGNELLSCPKHQFRCVLGFLLSLSERTAKSAPSEGKKPIIFILTLHSRRK
ncbi:hypothetical protein D918_08701 [Trichuris suis]|nr:hypothetical protein D918_08701 [Trichuris suis]